MANDYYSKIRGIEARMNRLKTLGLSSASSLSVASKTLTLPFQIVALRTVAGEVLDCGSSREAYVRITPQGNQPCFAIIYLTDDHIHRNRRAFFRRVYKDDEYIFRIYLSGTSDDLADLNRGVVLPSQDYHFKLYCTSNFNYSITWVNMV